MSSHPIYLDGFATLPLAPEARNAMLEAWSAPGNGGSAHMSGERAAGIVATARQAVADGIGAAPGEIYFTSGATEANNILLLGLAGEAAGKRIIVSAVEHKSVLEPARILREHGVEVEIAPVNGAGRLDLSAFEAMCSDGLLFASVMMVNNETGIVQPVAEAAAIAHRYGGLFHSDAAQAFGKIPIDVAALDVDYLSLSAHKCYGPMGVGALFASTSAPTPSPLMFGGRQERGLRPGTEPVALIAGFGAAARRACQVMEDDAARAEALVSSLLERLSAQQLRFRRITEGHSVVPGSAAISIDGVDGDELCARVAREVSISTGSACASGQLSTSHVLGAMGLSGAVAHQVIRIYCNKYLDERDLIIAADHIAHAARRCRLATG